MGILGWIVFGLIVGAIAKLLMPGRDPGGIIVTMVLGIVGALLGGFIGQAVGRQVRQFLNKPFSTDKLLNAVARTLAG